MLTDATRRGLRMVWTGPFPVSGAVVQVHGGPDGLAHRVVAPFSQCAPSVTVCIESAAALPVWQLRA